MKVKISNKRIVIILLIILFVVGVKIYNYQPKFEIDYSKYVLSYGVASTLFSPDNKHSISVEVCKEDKNSDVSYIRGDLYVVKEDSLDFYKTIYLEKVPSDKLYNGLTGDSYYEKCDVEWIDNQHIQINGRVVDIYEGYDYRK